MSVAKWRRVWLVLRRGARARATRRARARCQSGQAVWGGSEVDEGMHRAEWLCRGHHFPQSSMSAVRVPGLAISRHEPGSLGSKRALATPARRFSTRHTLGDRPLSWLRARPPRWRCHVLVLGLMLVLADAYADAVAGAASVHVHVHVHVHGCCCVPASRVVQPRVAAGGQPVSPACLARLFRPSASPAPSHRCRSGTTCVCVSTFCYCY
jgi:hypothetical protein